MEAQWRIRTYFAEILSEIHISPLKKMHLEMYAKCRQFVKASMC